MLPDANTDRSTMLLVVALVIVLLFAGLGFALHVLWVVAVVLLVLWLIGFVVGRGEGAGNHKFYKW
jgi:energy-coupling factor transporter transmembrane protein EcfT